MGIGGLVELSFNFSSSGMLLVHFKFTNTVKCMHLPLFVSLLFKYKKRCSCNMPCQLSCVGRRKARKREEVEEEDVPRDCSSFVIRILQ